MVAEVDLRGWVVCGRCRASNRPEDRFCERCGVGQPYGGPAPEPPGRRSHGLLPALVSMVVIVVFGVAGATFLLRPTSAEPDPVAAPRPESLAVPTWPSALAVPPPSVSAAPSAVPAPAPPVVAGSLEQQLGTDRGRVEAVVGKWVPQISSKAPGLVVGGITYDEARILAEFRTSRASYPDAVLVRSADFRSFAFRDHWVTVVARTFPTAGAANTWCQQQGLGPRNCFAKRLSRTSGPIGNTSLRR